MVSVANSNGVTFTGQYLKVQAQEELLTWSRIS